MSRGARGFNRGGTRIILIECPIWLILLGRGGGRGGFQQRDFGPPATVIGKIFIILTISCHHFHRLQKWGHSCML
jgi:hypothetical protein